MKAVILLSGGLDSTLNLTLALEQGRECLAIGFDYGQKHRVELDAAKRIADYYQVPYQILQIDTNAFGQCALVNGDVVKGRTLSDLNKDKLSPNYVPGRNTLFLSYALSFAESHQAEEIYFGGNAADHAFPDCSQIYVDALQKLISCGFPHTKIKIVAPLLKLSKKQIADEARRLGVPINMTHSCYDPVGNNPCEKCDACLVRKTCLNER